MKSSAWRVAEPADYDDYEPAGNDWDALDLTVEAADDDYADVLDLAGLAGVELPPGDLPAPAFAPLELSIPADHDVFGLADDDDSRHGIEHENSKGGEAQGIRTLFALIAERYKK